MASQFETDGWISDPECDGAEHGVQFSPAWQRTSLPSFEKAPSQLVGLHLCACFRIRINGGRAWLCLRHQIVLRDRIIHSDGAPHRYLFSHHGLRHHVVSGQSRFSWDYYRKKRRRGDGATAFARGDSGAGSAGLASIRRTALWFLRRGVRRRALHRHQHARVCGHRLLQRTFALPDRLRTHQGRATFATCPR